MWDYKVIAGRYALDGADVTVENPLGRGTLQRILDHYGAEGFELVSTHYDGINREVVLLLKRPKGGVAMAPVMAAQPAAAGGVMAGPAGFPPAARGAPAAAAKAEAAGGQGRRRSKHDLDRLARDD